MDTNFTAKEKILVHLLDHYGKNDGYALSATITQDGISERVGLKQNTVSYAVRSLTDDALVREETRRIKGKKQKRKAYFLTEEGVDEAEKIKNKVADTKIKAKLNGEEKRVRIGELNAYLNTNLSFVEILKKVEVEGKIEQEGVKDSQSLTAYLYQMPKPLSKSAPEIENLLEWYKKEVYDDHNMVCVVGEDGSGKTSVLTSFAKEMEEETNIFYFKVKKWHSRMHFWTILARFLEKTGQYRLSSYLYAPYHTETKEVLTNLRKDLKSISSLFLIDDIHLNKDIQDLVKKLDESKGLASMKVVTSAEDDQDGYIRSMFKEKQLFRLESSNSLKEKVKDFYGIPGNEDPLDSALKKHITPEEFQVLALLSILRKPIRKKELSRLESVNENIVNSLLNTPLLEVTVDKKPIIHPLIMERISKLLDDDYAKKLHKIAYRYYRADPISKELDSLEELYHISKEGDTDLFEKRVEKLGEKILSSGFSKSLSSIIHEYKKEIDEDKKIPDFIIFLEGVAYKAMGRSKQAVEKYREALELTHDVKVEIQSRHGIAIIKEEEGDYDEAISEYQKAIKLEKNTEADAKKKEMFGISRIRVSSLLNEKGKYEEAKNNLKIAINILGEDNHSLLTSTHLMLARIEKSEGDWEKAVEHFERGLDHWEEIDETYQRVGGLKEIGALCTILRELDDAEEHLREAVQTSEKFGYWHLKASALLSLAECYLERGKFDKCIEVSQESRELLDELEEEEEKALAHSLLAKAYSMNSQEEKSEKELTKAISIYQRLGSSYRLGLAYFSMAKLQEKMGNKEGIAKNYRKAILSFSGSGASWMAEKVEKEMDTIPISM